MVAGATDGRFIPKLKPKSLEIQAVDKGIDGTNGVLTIHKILHTSGQQHGLSAIQSFHECHGQIVRFQPAF